MVKRYEHGDPMPEIPLSLVVATIVIIAFGLSICGIGLYAMSASSTDGCGVTEVSK